MNRDLAHEILNSAQSGANVSEKQIIQCLRATGDLSGVSAWRAMHEEESPSADRLHKHLVRTARQQLMQSGMGHVTDEFAIRWAEQILRVNAARAATFLEAGETA